MIRHWVHYDSKVYSFGTRREALTFIELNEGAEKLPQSHPLVLEKMAEIEALAALEAEKYGGDEVARWAGLKD